MACLKRKKKTDRVSGVFFFRLLEIYIRKDQLPIVSGFVKLKKFLPQLNQ